ncbi:hypothetical protein YC2023_107417 [Brassica napus]
MGGAVKDITSKSELDNLRQSGAPIALHFWASWYISHCFQNAYITNSEPVLVYLRLQAKHKKWPITFIKHRTHDMLKLTLPLSQWAKDILHKFCGWLNCYLKHGCKHLLLPLCVGARDKSHQSIKSPFTAKIIDSSSILYDYHPRPRYVVHSDTVTHSMQEAIEISLTWLRQITSHLYGLTRSIDDIIILPVRNRKGGQLTSVSTYVLRNPQVERDKLVSTFV